ncbi:MAG: DNA repair protein RecN [Actinobacteria bacterium]|nr:DNA repair protein RecN [Actinomycetota bacterium]
MLSELVVENLGPIAGAEIVLQAGSSALTGETGAGKTLLVTAVTLLTGGRADRGIIRDGATEARVEGRFVVGVDHPAIALLEARDLLDDGGDQVELVVTRTISPSGSRARVNGRLVPLSVLAEIGPTLVEIAGQHEHHHLASPRAQRATLDAFAGAEAVELAAAVAAEVRELGRVERDLEGLRASERERARELDVLRFEIEEIEAASIRVGEIAELSAEATRLENAEDIGGAVLSAVEELGGDGGADDRVAVVLRELERVTAKDPSMARFVERVAALSEEMRDIAAELAARIEEPDPASLEAVRDRLGELARLRRKYGDDEHQIVEYLDRSKARAEELAAKTNSIEELSVAADRLRADAVAKATTLSTIRKDAAATFEREVEALLNDLAMPAARFVVTIEDADLYEGGIDAVAFEVATGPGEKPRPLVKIASGGELSRIALALHLLARGGAAPTMIFDEVDAGVGGAAARAVGAALARLGRDGAQVVVVTHLPQVAAFADSHYRVQRHDGARRDVTVQRVEGSQRVEELSRMLAGLPESERAREHAQELLDLAASGAGR